MENISVLRSDTSERSITFKLTNTTDTDKDVYIKDITLYSFLRNIDWVNNVFSWVELRDIPINTLVCNSEEYPDGNTADDDTQTATDQAIVEEPITEGTEGGNNGAQSPMSGNTDGTEDDDTVLTMQVPILCCLRIPPGVYQNTESVINMINAKLTDLKDLAEYKLAIEGIHAIHNIPGCVYDIGDIAILESETKIPPWYPAMINSPVVLNNFDISLDNINTDPPEHIPCIPVLEYDANTKGLSLPLEGSLNYNNLPLYNSDLLSKMGSGSLTSHAITFVNGITNTLTIDKIDISIEDLYTSEYGLIRYRENANNYTEYIVNPSNTELIEEIQRKYDAMKAINVNWNDAGENVTIDKGVQQEYHELTTNGVYKIFSCIAYPFFPVSTKLYLYNCNAPYIDKVIESQISTERLFGASLATVDVGSEWTPNYDDTLTFSPTIRPITVPVNSIMTIPHGSTTSIYVIGDNQRYPLWRSSHSLTYRVIN